MDFKGIWLIDPSTGKPSVSLTLLIISFMALVIASGLHLKQLTNNTSSLLELFYACASLYFGRRLSFSNGSSKTDLNGKEEG